jgi:PAS domain-containing protein
LPQVIADPRLETLYRYWMGKRHGRPMPSRADIDPVDIPTDIWPHTMVLDVLWQGGSPRFRYRRVGEVYWRALGQEPTGCFIDEVLPETAGYRAYVIGIYTEMAVRGRAMYTENIFALSGQAVPMLTKRVSLPLSHDGDTVDMALAGHVFEYGKLDRDRAFSLVTNLEEVTRRVLDS